MSDCFFRGRKPFQSTLPRGERLLPSSVVMAGHQSFNPRSREGSDDHISRPSYRPISFNPRSREGSDHPRSRLLASFSSFNPRSREGSDKEEEPGLQPIETFQSTLPRGERRIIHCRLASFQVVSIHAPARGATRDARYNLIQTYVSIPSRERGLKQPERRLTDNELYVAPLAGAWIET